MGLITRYYVYDDLDRCYPDDFLEDGYDSKEEAIEAIVEFFENDSANSDGVMDTGYYCTPRLVIVEKFGFEL